jgi:hypothetical protein
MPDGPAAGDPTAEDQAGEHASTPVGDGPAEGSDPLRFNKWMKRSATGAVLTGITMGLRQALEPTKKEPAFMVEASGQPEDPDNPIRLQFDPDSPEDTVAYIRRPAHTEGADTKGAEMDGTAAAGAGTAGAGTVGAEPAAPDPAGPDQDPLPG